MSKESTVGAKRKMCSVSFAEAWKDLAEKVLPELGLEDGQAFARQRKGGIAFHARGTACAKAK